MGSLSWWHWLLIIAAFVLIFGAKKLPDAARGVGRSLRILKSEVSAMHEDGGKESTPSETDESAKVATPPSQIAATPAPPAPAAAPQTAAPQTAAPQQAAVSQPAAPQQAAVPPAAPPQQAAPQAAQAPATAPAPAAPAQAPSVPVINGVPVSEDQNK